VVRRQTEVLVVEIVMIAAAVDAVWASAFNRARTSSAVGRMSGSLLSKSMHKSLKSDGVSSNTDVGEGGSRLRLLMMTSSPRR
jgi:hypothetical protein